MTTETVKLADPIDTSKIRPAFLGISPGAPSGAGLIVGDDVGPCLVWSGQGPSDGVAMLSVLTKARDAAAAAGSAIPPFVAIGGLTLPGHHASDLVVTGQLVDAVELSRSAGGWRAVAQATEYPLIDADGSGFQPSAWRDILGGPAPAAFGPARWKRWARVMVETIFGGAPIPGARSHEAEAILIALAAMIARSNGPGLARWAGTVGRQVTRAVDPPGQPKGPWVPE